jgi:CubicO group peptidase (beta-lactamase class C family)
VRRGAALGWLAALCALALGAGAGAGELPSARPEPLGLSPERLARLERVLREHVEQGRLAGAVGLLLRRGRVVWSAQVGWRDREAGARMSPDAIFRIASMSKPITSVAVMQLVEEGRLLLSDPVSRYLPELRGLQVAQERVDPRTGQVHVETVPARREMTVQDLLRHTSGLTYGFFGESWVDRRYRELDVFTGDRTLAETVTRLAGIPLKHQPGEVWEYSVSVDVLSRLVEVVSGQSFDRFLRERLFEPLDMRDTAFELPAEKLGRVAALYQPADDGTIRPVVPSDSQDPGKPKTYFSGGGGLVSTARDYARFAQMLLDGGALDGQRLLGRKTVELMRSDHLDGIPGPDPGYGFGLGFGVRTAPGVVPQPGSVGEFYWGGAYGTSFWIDPAEQLIGVFMIQLYPQPRAYDAEFKTLAYQAVVD